MKVTKTLNWIQKHAGDSSIRANILTTVTDDTGAVIASSGEDVTLTHPEAISAASSLESTVRTLTGAELPVVAATPAPTPVSA
jgi:hypothetical protein